MDDAVKSIRGAKGESDIKKPRPISDLVFFVNGKKVLENNPKPQWTLLWYLRNKLNLYGTKLGCAEGGCGACTVMISKYNRQTCAIDDTDNRHIAANACLTPLCAMHGLAITTVEGIGSTRQKIHPVQERIAKAHGSQCGFCTPGIVMSMYALLRSRPFLSYQDIEEAFQGNLCRCTGYRPIIEGYKTFIEEYEKRYQPNCKTDFQNCGLGVDCCKNKNNSSAVDNPTPLFDKSSFQPYDNTQEPIFPPEIILNSQYDKEFLVFHDETETWYRPTTLEVLLELKNKYPNAKLIVGNTEVGVEMKFKNLIYPIKINPSYINELMTVEEKNDCVIIGAAVPITVVQSHLKTIIGKNDLRKTKILKCLSEMFYWFAGKQIRNVACIGGNIMTSSPISDLNPLFMASNCSLKVISQNNGIRYIDINDIFFTGYRKNVIKRDEVLISIKIPFTKKTQFFQTYKQSRRKEDDISIVTAAFNVEFDERMTSLVKVSLAYGGIAPTTILAKRTSALLVGSQWDQNLLNKVFEHLLEELQLSPSAPGGMVQYRRSLILSLFFKFYLWVKKEFSLNGFSHSNPIAENKNIHLRIPECSQYFQIVDSNQNPCDSVGRALPHVSSNKQATGEAVYCDDIPHIDGQLYLAFVLSDRANAKILSINYENALKISGVKAFISASSLTAEQNRMGPLFEDEEIFISEKVQCQGRPLGAILATDQLTAQKAAKLVKVEYEDSNEIIITIEDAITKRSFFPQSPYTVKKGDIDESFNRAELLVEGESRTGAQEHFYLETQCVVAIPTEDNEMEIYASSQQPAETSRVISKVLGIPMNRIVTKVKRAGGGFGGKEYRSMLVALPVAIAAYKFQKPIRCMLDRDEDMMMTGNRHPFLCKYKAACTRQGNITGLKVTMYNNAGCSMDVSCLVMIRAMYHVTNAYYIPNVQIEGYVCKTNLPSNTAFRGFGAPQAMLAMETVIRQIAQELKIAVEDVSRLNLLRQGDLTTLNQSLDHCTLIRCWDECIEKSDYHSRKKEIENYNRENRWTKRGISIVPTAFGISFGTNFMMQAGALVHIYTDGSVLLSHGGMEMGQGLHTKMIQIASRVLKIDVSMIHISDTSTDKVPNTLQTAGSVSSDLNGMAVMRACLTLKERIKPYKEKNPNGKWQEWVEAAYFDRVSLSTTGFYSSQEITYDREKNSGHIYEYYTYGAAASEVEIDCLTGDHKVLRTDIVMDLGESLNPAIDVGQIEGAFMQGYGMFTLEEILYSPTGTLLTKGPGAYKIPGFSDIPLEFNVSLLKGAPNPRAVYSSKAVGEPPLFLASSVFFAIKEAISSARKDSGADPKFALQAPATSAKIRMACEDHITRMIEEPNPDSYVPWCVTP